MHVHIGIIGRDKTTQLSLALFVIVSDSVTLGERAYNSIIPLFKVWGSVLSPC